jgi:triosephosphate isomerase
MLVVLNNKCNLGKKEFKKYYEQLQTINKNNHNLVLCPTFLNISLVLMPNFDLGSQNVSAYESGAYTGEVSAEQLKEMNVNYSLVGHSERREYQKENGKDLNEKIKQLMKNDIIPILCIGETKEERENNTYKSVLKKQIEETLFDIKDLDQLVIAYEPIWSIGTGIIPSNDQIEEVFQILKELLPNQKILYGGSANEENIKTLNEITLIDGYLLGGLSLKPEKLEYFLKQI